MNLNDQIIDEAEALACAGVVLNTREEIVKAVSEKVNCTFATNSPFGFLAEAAYRRYAVLVREVA